MRFAAIVYNIKAMFQDSRSGLTAASQRPIAPPRDPPSGPSGCGAEHTYTTPHQNTHLSMPLKERGFAGRGLILWGIGPCDARVQRGL